MPLPINSRGYLLPETIDPGEYICVQVYIPNTDEYIRAFSGHLELLGTWKEWEKDGTNRASQAAQVWKDALDFSRENGWIGVCGMDCCEELIEAISNLQLNVNVSVNCSGCGGGNQLKDWRVPDGWEDEWPSDPIPEDETPSGEPNGNLCDAAHSTHAEIRTRLQEYAQLVNEASPYAALYAWLTGWALGNPSAALVWRLISDYTSIFYDALVANAVSFWDDMKEEYICQMIASDSAGEFKSWLIDYVRENAPRWEDGYYIELILTGTTFNTIYDGTYIPFPEFVGSDCSYCYMLEVPDLPDGWYIEPVYNDDVTTYAKEGNTTEITISGMGGNEYESQQLIGAAPRYDFVVFDGELIKARIDAPGALIRRGIIIRYTFHTQPETMDDTNINQYIRTGNFSSQSRMGWTRTTRYQVRYKQGATPQGVIDAMDNFFDDAAIIPISYIGDAIDDEFGVQMNDANSNGRFLVWVIYEDVG